MNQILFLSCFAGVFGVFYQFSPSCKTITIVFCGAACYFEDLIQLPSEMVNCDFSNFYLI